MLNYYAKQLKEQGLKITPQRLEILRYLDENRTHPTVEEIYSALKKHNPSLSKTTVYNALQALQNSNVIQSLTISSSEARYDIKQGLHHHFLCTHCGAILDVDIACPNIKKTLKGGHKVEEVHGYFKGICETCIKKQPKKTGKKI